MSFNSFLRVYGTLAIAIAHIVGCSHALHPFQALDVPVEGEGNRYYSLTTAKYLGKDSDVIGACRLIDSSWFVRIGDSLGLRSADALKMLKDSSRIITVDYYHIQSEIQRIHDSSMRYGVEYQIFLYVDRWTAEISSVRGLTGTATGTSPDVKSIRSKGITRPDVNDRDTSRWIMIGQVHGHPPGKADSVVKPEMSDSDMRTAQILQVAVYAVDAFDGNIGKSGNIHRANPDPNSIADSQDDFIASSWGKHPSRTKIKLDIAVDAFQRWSHSQTPNFIELDKRTIHRRLNAPPATPSSQPPPQ